MTTILVLLTLASAAQAQAPNNCPMHAQHMAAQTQAHSSDHDFAAMQQRGEKAMGFDQEKTTHHFLLTDDGGRIEVQVNSADDRANVDNIRRHLQQIAKAFASGDFAIPMQVHEQTPAGTAEMQRLKDHTNYRYQELPQGGAVVISSADAEAVAAIHDFLRFQITEHHTGDPVAPKR